MSPVNRTAIIPLALRDRGDAAAVPVRRVLATIAAIVGATVAIGYAYGTPLLYGGGTIPVSLPTGPQPPRARRCHHLAAVPDWAARPLSETTARRMLRAFLRPPPGWSC